MDTRAAFAAVDDLQDAAVATLQRLVAIPSVSASGEQLETAAGAVAELAQEAGFEIEIWSTRGAPVVFASLPAPAGAPSVLFYGHYDVQPPDPVEAWESPPFAPKIRDGALYGRGAGDNKGQFLAHLIAARALRQAGGCPVGIKLLIEGEEEIGSPNLADCVATRRQALACDLVLTADGPYHDDGRPLMIFGVRGLLYLEVRAQGSNRDLHSGNRGGLVPNPAWELVETLASLKDEAGRVRVPGFYDSVLPPTEAEQAMLAALPFDREAMLDDLGIANFLQEAERTPWESLMFWPNLNLAGLSSGYAGPGAKTIVPREARAKLEVRLVADQDPDAIADLLTEHLSAGGLIVEQLASVPPSRTAPDTPYAAPVAKGLEAATGQPPWRRPRLGGTTPDYVFTQLLGAPSLLIPYGSPDMDHHAPNEKLRLEDLRRGGRASAAICLALAEAGRLT